MESLVPFMELKDFRGRKKGVCLPFSDFSDDPADSHNAQASPGAPISFEVLTSLVEKLHWRTMDFKGSRHFFDTEFDCPTAVLSHTVNLRGTPEELYRNMDSSTRRNIKKAQREGVQIIKETSPEAMHRYYQLQCETRKRHGLPPQPKRFFLNIYRNIISQNLGMVVSAKLKDRIIASAVFFQVGSKALYKFGASQTAFWHLRPNNLIMWEAFQHYQKSGMESLSLGITETENKGLIRFKKGLGGVEDKLFNWRYHMVEKKFLTLQSKVSGFHNHVFKRLPQPVSRGLGYLMYRYMG